MKRSVTYNFEYDITLPNIATHGDERKAFPQGHPLGVCYKDIKHKVVYLNIPKTASTSLKFWCERNGFRRTYEHQKCPVPDSYTTFCVFRHPVSRYISGALQYFERNSSNFDVTQFIEEQLEKIVSRENLILDAHTTPQYVFITRNFTINVYLIFERLHDDLNRFVASLNNSYDSKLIYQNKSSRRNTNYFKRRIDKRAIDYIKEFYYQDMLIYQSNVEIPSKNELL